MSKTKETAVATTTQIDGNTSIAILAVAESVPTAGNFELESGNYFKFEEGNTYNFICNGLCDGVDYNDKDKTIENGAVELVTTEGHLVINQDAVMISTINKMVANGKSFPRLLRVYAVGKRLNSKQKEYMDLQIASADITDAMINAVQK